MMNKLKHCSMDITAPFVFKMEDGVEFNESLNVVVGENGCGKTFLFVTCFAGVAIMSSLASEYHEETVDDDVARLAESICKMTFDEFDEFTGSFSVTMQDGQSVNVSFKEGHVTECVALLDSTVLGSLVPPMMFMSSNMRTFDTVHGYLKMRKALNSDKDVAFALVNGLTAEGIERMTEFYKLYDITFVEGLIKKCPIVDPSFAERLKPFEINNSPVALEVDLNDCKFLATGADGEKRSLSRYSKGEQALINMIAGVL